MDNDTNTFFRGIIDNVASKLDTIENNEIGSIEEGLDQEANRVNNLEYEEYWAEYKREWLRQNSQMLESDYNNWVENHLQFVLAYYPPNQFYIQKTQDIFLLLPQMY